MKLTLQQYREHIEARKKEYWGKDEYLYRFYDAQLILILDLICMGYGEDRKI